MNQQHVGSSAFWEKFHQLMDAHETATTALANFLTAHRGDLPLDAVRVLGEHGGETALVLQTMVGVAAARALELREHGACTARCLERLEAGLHFPLVHSQLALELALVHLLQARHFTAADPCEQTLFGALRRCPARSDDTEDPAASDRRPQHDPGP